MTNTPDDRVERGAIALARHTFYGGVRGGFEQNGQWPPNYPENSKQAARAKVKVILAATDVKVERERCNCDASCGENRYHNKGEPGCRFRPDHPASLYENESKN